MESPSLPQHLRVSLSSLPLREEGVIEVVRSRTVLLSELILSSSRPAHVAETILKEGLVHALVEMDIACKNQIFRQVIKLIRAVSSGQEGAGGN